jgi:hypothetical protein
VLLSRYPLDKTETYVLPSSWVTLSAIKARVNSPAKTAVDVYCTNFGAIRDGLTEPYTGYYGEGAVDKQGWIAEQRIAFGIVALNPCGGELHVGDVGAVFDLLEHSGERHRQRGESLVEILQREADRLAGKNVADRILERDQLRTGSACAIERFHARSWAMQPSAPRPCPALWRGRDAASASGGCVPGLCANRSRAGVPPPKQAKRNAKGPRRYRVRRIGAGGNWPRAVAPAFDRPWHSSAPCCSRWSAWPSGNPMPWRAVNRNAGAFVPLRARTSVIASCVAVSPQIDSN